MIPDRKWRKWTVFRSLQELSCKLENQTFTANIIFFKYYLSKVHFLLCGIISFITAALIVQAWQKCRGYCENRKLLKIKLTFFIGFYFLYFLCFFVYFFLQVILLNSHLPKREIVICDKKDSELRSYLLFQGLPNLMIQHLFWVNFGCRASFVRKLRHNFKFSIK